VKHPSFRTVSESPWNGSPDPRYLAKHAITPREHFFVRNHGDIPFLDGDDHVVRINGLVEHPLTITVRELKALEHGRIEATLMCAGNRREQLSAHREVPHELPWGHEAIGNAVWGGVWLADLLAKAVPTAAAQHVCFRGADVATAGGGKGELFGASVPLDDVGLVMLALTMNDHALPREHGAPVRIVAPAYIAARSVKWLTEITLSETPSPSYYQQKAYRLYPPEVRSLPAAVDAPMLGPQQLNSAVLEPAAGTTLKPGTHTIRGWAIAAREADITHVEVSVDGGRFWEEATLTHQPRGLGWTLWELEVALTPGAYEVVCRAFDDRDEGESMQPAAVEAVWNIKGYMNTAWHRVRISVS
jgi:sulfite oxidase